MTERGPVGPVCAVTLGLPREVPLTLRKDGLPRRKPVRVRMAPIGRWVDPAQPELPLEMVA